MGSMGAGGTTWTAMESMGGTWAAMRGTAWTAMGSMGGGGTTWTVPRGGSPREGARGTTCAGGTAWAAMGCLGAGGTTVVQAMVDVLERRTCQKETLRTRKLRKTMLPTRARWRLLLRA